MSKNEMEASIGRLMLAWVESKHKLVLLDKNSKEYQRELEDFNFYDKRKKIILEEF